MRSPTNTSPDERLRVAQKPIIVFDVNETLLDPDTLQPTFERIFDDPAAMRLRS
jgi:2-haloacid dehalogenase